MELTLDELKIAMLDILIDMAQDERCDEDMTTTTLDWSILLGQLDINRAKKNIEERAADGKTNNRDESLE